LKKKQILTPPSASNPLITTFVIIFNSPISISTYSSQSVLIRLPGHHAKSVFSFRIECALRLAPDGSTTSLVALNAESGI
uniref:MSP domain-containing protein n=1 Tax=Schistosoma curassoni TaxID=6186 RepID=A0A183JJI4_9TREM